MLDVLIHDRPPTSSADRCIVVDNCERRVANAAHQRGGVEPSVSWPSVREVDGRLRVVSNTRDHWDIQSFGDLAAAVRLPLADNDQAEMSAIVGIEPRMITERRQVNTGTHDRSESRVQHHGSQGAALQQRRRWSGLAKATTVDDHVDIDIGQAVEGLGQVFPHSTEMRLHCSAC